MPSVVENVRSPSYLYLCILLIVPLMPWTSGRSRVSNLPETRLQNANLSVLDFKTKRITNKFDQNLDLFFYGRGFYKFPFFNCLENYFIDFMQNKIYKLRRSRKNIKKSTKNKNKVMLSISLIISKNSCDIEKACRFAENLPKSTMMNLVNATFHFYGDKEEILNRFLKSCKENFNDNSNRIMHQKVNPKVRVKRTSLNDKNEHSKQEENHLSMMNIIKNNSLITSTTKQPQIFHYMNSQIDPILPIIKENHYENKTYLQVKNNIREAMAKAPTQPIKTGLSNFTSTFLSSPFGIGDVGIKVNSAPYRHVNASNFFPMYWRTMKNNRSEEEPFNTKNPNSKIWGWGERGEKFLGSPKSITSSVFDLSRCHTTESCQQDWFGRVNNGPPKRTACRCDANCIWFGDCCQMTAQKDPVKPSLEGSQFLHGIIKDHVSCIRLPPPLDDEAAYVIDKCHADSSSFLIQRCHKSIPGENYSYLLDLPVVSNVTGILYANIFCALCNHDPSIHPPHTTMSCKSQTSGLALDELDYLLGTLSWEKGKEKEVECTLFIHLNFSNVRWCPKEIIDKCSVGWNRNYAKYLETIAKQCSKETFFVKANQKYFKNPFCAICNGVSYRDLECLESEINTTIKDQKSEFSVHGILSHSTLCSNNQLWDPLNGTCLNIDCDSSGKSTNICSTSGFDYNFGRSVLRSPCKSTLRNSESSVYYSNGTIYLPKPKLYFDHGQYEIVGNNNIKVCVLAGRWTNSMKLLSTILISISLVCLVLHMTLFIALPKRRNIPSMNLFSLSIALFSSNLIFLCFFHYNKINILCKMFAATLYYFLSVVFIWMNVMSIDIYQTFRSSRYKIKSKKLFVRYSLYAWVLPIFSTSIVVFVDIFARKDFFIAPDFGSERCWFNNKWGHAVFFTLPAEFIVLTNMVLYSLSVWGIYKQRKLGKLASSTIQLADKKGERNNGIKRNALSDSRFSLNAVKIKPKLNSSSSAIRSTQLSTNVSAKSSEKISGSLKKRRNSLDTEISFQQKIRDKLHRRIKVGNKHRIRLVLYSKMALIMGMTWIFAFLSFHTKSLILDYLFIIFNGLQGAFIFLAFDCKTNIWNELRERVGWIKMKSFDLTDSTTFTRSGVYVQNKNGFYESSSLSNTFKK